MNYRMYFQPVDIDADSPEEAQRIFLFSRIQPDIIRVILAENNVWDHRDEKKIKVE